MGNVCQGGEFNGMAVWTREDANVCTAGGGHVEGGGNGPCSALTVAGFAAEPPDLNPLHHLQDVYGGTEEVSILDRLNRAAADTVGRLAERDPDLATDMVDGLARIARLADAVVNGGELDYDGETHEILVRLAERVAEHAEDDDVRGFVRDAIAAAEPYIGMTTDRIRDRLGPLPDLSGVIVTHDEIPHSRITPVAGKAKDILDAQNMLKLSARFTDDYRPFVHEFLAVQAAERAIDEKAAAMGLPVGGEIEIVPGGYLRVYGGYDIYYSPETGAHEVHGEIRAKYDRVNGPAWLGLPTTDERGTPDGRGKYNHFAKDASIYWTDTTGPMIVRGQIRRLWAQNGWETSGWGYPVQDEQRIPGLYPGDHPKQAWSAFEHGMLFSDTGPAEAVFAEASAVQVAGALRARFDRALQPRTYTLGHISTTAKPGLYGVDFLGTQPWSYGFWSAVPRSAKFRVNGFVSLPIVSDPTFWIEASLRFTTHWRAELTYPTVKTVIATLVGYKVHVDGVLSGEIKDAIEDSIKGAFGPDPAHPDLPPWSIHIGDVPTGVSQRGEGRIDAMDVMVMADGSIRLYLNPLPPSIGAFRKSQAQIALNNALGIENP